MTVWNLTVLFLVLATIDCSLSAKKEAKLTYYLIAEDYAVYFHNEETKTVAYLDLQNATNVFYCGNTGRAFVFSLLWSTGVYIPGGVSNQTWLARSEDFNSYFKKPTAPLDLYDIGRLHGKEFNQFTITRDVQKKLTDILVTLSLSYSSISNAYSDANEYVLLSDVVTNEYLITLFSNTRTKILPDLHSVRGIYRGLRTFLELFNNDLKEEAVRLDLVQILNQKSGLGILNYLIGAINPKVAVGPAIGPYFKSPARAFFLIDGLTGTVLHGYRGFILIVEALVNHAYGELSEDNFKTFLTLFFKNKRETKEKLKENWENDIRRLHNTIKRTGVDKDLSNFVKQLRGIQSNDWVIKGVNLTAVIDVIFKIKRPAGRFAVNKVLKKLRKYTKNH